MNETKRQFTAEEILQRQRAEFDYIWDTQHREQNEGMPQFDLADYAIKLETMLLNRFDEAGLPRYSQGKGGIAELESQKASTNL